MMLRVALHGVFGVGLVLGQPQAARAPRAVIVASKPFGESYLLAEMFAQLLEARGFATDRRLGLGATEIAFQALRTNRIDVYPEYTGTGLLAILGERPSADPSAVYRQVSREFRVRYGARWLPPLGFQNTYAIAVRRETARRLGLATLTDLAAVSSRLRAGLTPDFIGRPDGLPGLEKAYGIHFLSVRALLPAVKYQALAAGEVDIIDGYSTDGFIARYDLVILKDDRRFFPPYEAAALTSPAFSRDLPDAVAALTELSGLLTEEDMRRLNRRIEVDNDPVPAVASDALRSLGLTGTTREARRATGRTGEGVTAYLWHQRGIIGGLVLRHLLLVGISLAAAVALAVPLGLLLERSRRIAESAIRAVSLLQTVPSIALLAFMIPLLGIGVVPALVALFLYSLYPILRNTYTGVRDAAPDAVGAAWALGMTPRQILRYVRLPLAAPVIMAGIRTAAVINVGTATLAAFIGAGGLGDPIAAGLALSDTRMILSGALPAAVLALLVDGALGVCERLVAPGG
jgi:osmoprotectant transport system substrate-binding protein/osmoprotectant transport system permease protein